MITRVTMVGLFTLLLSCCVWAEKKAEPLVDWHIQTVVSDGIPNRHAVIRRAILSPQETWPRLDVEVIDWTNGMGGQKMLLQKQLDIEAGLKICPDPAESWCGKMGDISWKNRQMHYSFQAKNKNYQCVVTIADDLAIVQKCQ